MEESDQSKYFAQPGFQEAFCSSPADLCIGGGAAGAGKTIGLLLCPIPFVFANDQTLPSEDISKFTAGIFRTTYGEIKMEGGMWEKSKEVYHEFDGIPKEGSLSWRFPGGGGVSFEHLGHERELYKYQGAEFNMIGFDEVTHYTKKSFFYMLTRNRSMSGIKPFLRGTCNPDPDSFVAELVKWWINQDTGFPILERQGVIRFMVMDGDRYVWGNSKQEVYNKAKHVFHEAIKHGIKVEDMIKSVTFIGGTIYGNKKLLQKNPAYLANLMAQDDESRSQLLDGNWKIRTDGKSLFDFHALKGMFGNIIPITKSQKYIVIDHARFGKDLLVIGTWEGWNLVRIDIWHKSDTNRILKTVEELRRIYRPIPYSNVVIDQDGTGFADATGCEMFRGSAKAQKVKLDNIVVEANYSNFKTQCAYHVSEIVNKGLMSVTKDQFYVDGVRSETIKINGATRLISQMIIDDLRVIRREKPEAEGRKMINNKASQKNALDGRSPDFGDMINQRAFFDLWKRPVYLTRVS